MTKYHGPILIIRRWNDEIIVTQEMTADQETKRASNRANNLLINVGFIIIFIILVLYYQTIFLADKKPLSPTNSKFGG
jgi:hypothetical protein